MSVEIIPGNVDVDREVQAIKRSAQRPKSYQPGPVTGGAIWPQRTIMTVPIRTTLPSGQIIPGEHPDQMVAMPDGRFMPAGRLHIIPGGRDANGRYAGSRLVPAIAGGDATRFTGINADPPIANLTAVVATTETILWNVTRYSPIAALEARANKIYHLVCGGIWTNNTTGTLILTGRIGLTVGAGITMGANVNAQTVPGSAVSNNPFRMEMDCVIRSIGDPGANSVAIATGQFVTGGLGTVGTSICIGFGGATASFDSSIATGLLIGWTLSVAGTVTPEYVYLQPLN